MSPMSKPRPSIDFGYPTEAHGPVPAFASIEEEAEFWDTHDLTDYIKDWVEAELTVGPELREKITLRLDPEDREELDRRARELGVGPATLVRMWIKEHLRREAS